jgi:ribosome modulation factor
MSADIAENDPFEEGYNAAIDGLSETQNPYPIGSEEYASWDKGFRAFEEDDIDY